MMGILPHMGPMEGFSKAVIFELGLKTKLTIDSSAEGRRDHFRLREYHEY